MALCCHPVSVSPSRLLPALGDLLLSQRPEHKSPSELETLHYVTICLNVSFYSTPLLSRTSAAQIFAPFSKLCMQHSRSAATLGLCSKTLQRAGWTRTTNLANGKRHALPRPKHKEKAFCVCKRFKHDDDYLL